MGDKSFPILTCEFQTFIWVWETNKNQSTNFSEGLIPYFMKIGPRNMHLQSQCVSLIFCQQFRQTYELNLTENHLSQITNLEAYSFCKLFFSFPQKEVTRCQIRVSVKAMTSANSSNPLLRKMFFKPLPNSRCIVWRFARKQWQ